MPTRPARSRTAARTAAATALALAAAVAPALGPAPAHAAAPARDDTLQHRLEQLVAAPGGPPGAIVVLHRTGPHGTGAGHDPGRTEVYRAGAADLRTGRPPRTHDHMRIASVAKAFSGAVALRLVDERRLRLDDTIGRVLPALPAAWHAVTLRQLLDHTSGLPDYSASPRFREILTANPRHRFDSRRLLDFVAGQPTRFTPGSRYAYSNSDNIAVALMAEAVTGRRYEDLLQELVYRPLGLRDTHLPQGHRLPEPYLHGYAVDPPAPPEDVSEAIGASGSWASGGIVSTPADLGTFIRAHASGALLSEATRRAQRAFVPGGASQPPGPGANDAGLALFRYTTRCGTVYGHIGNTPGYTQLAAATPDGTRSLTFTATSQIPLDPGLLARTRALQEDFVCALLRHG
ncbi:serine hydrolase domain-containing protein [Streptomyces sp. enrichment culture]|uniref:serine hydrolase domain-containing protein n=1 Tax=Streptomyces sp. enrichment culture TaxID=1795815 RepID=UPI003F54AD41